MPARTIDKKANIMTELASHIPRIFDQAQNSTANHHKNFVALHKLHAEAALHTEATANGSGFRLTGEHAFEDTFIMMAAKVLPVKKGASQGDRIVKFVGGYTRFVNERAIDEKAARVKNEDTDDEDEDEDTPASRFTARLLKFLLKGFQAKDKTIRYRVLQLVAEMVSHLGEVDEEIYMNLRASLLDRIHDKETPVRVQAVIALSKLAGSEDAAEVEDGEQTVNEVLIETLNYDPSPDVRKATLLNLLITPENLIPILERTRDTDNGLRRIVYSTILEPNSTVGKETLGIGMTHPRALTIAQRELIIRNGLGDREPAIRAAAANLIGVWVDVVNVGMKAEDEQKQRIEDGVVALLRLLDLTVDTIAEDALLSVFTSRADIFENVEFGDAYWAQLTPETAFLARVFVDHCIATKEEARLEAALPVVTALAFRIQSSYNDLLEDLQTEEEDRLLLDDLDEEEKARREDERLAKEFIIGEMLKLAVNLDYADEIGRRKMFQLVRDMISQNVLPEILVARCLDVLRKLSANERDLIRVVVEVIHDLRDPDTNDEEDDALKDADAETSYGETPSAVKPARVPLSQKPSAEMSPEEKAQSDEIDLKCLSLCIGMLERVNGTLEENVTLEGILTELIVPAVKRKELLFREKGLTSLGLCCLIAKRMAANSFQLFVAQIQSGPEAVKTRVLQIIFDVLMVHENEFLGQGGENSEKIIKFFIAILGQETSDKAQAIICMGLAKLVLAGMISDQQVLKNLLMAYLSPSTMDNQELRQCLSYFFPVYCYSSPANQRCMREIFIPMFEQLTTVRKELEDGQEIISSAQVGAMFVDWTDPLKALEARGQASDESIQFDMASDIVKALFNSDLEKEDKKALCQILGKLHIPETVDDDKLRTLKLLMHNIRSRRPLRDTTTNNAFTKFESMISKKFEKQLEDFNEEEYRKLEELKGLFEFLDEIIPEDDDEVVDLDAPKKGKKRRSGSIVSTSTEGNRAVTPTNRRGKSKGSSKTKRRRLSNSSDEESDFDEGRAESQGAATPPPRSSVAPTRTLPKRSAAAKKKPVEVIEISSDDDEDEDATPAPRKRPPPKKSSSTRIKQEEEAMLDAEIDDLLDSPVEEEDVSQSHDSLLDESEEEEEEVNDLLAE